jgi:hypothetical protein
MQNKLTPGLLLCCLSAALILLLPACKKTATSASAPAITAVKNYAASPADTVLNSLAANGQWVVITGQNLQNAVHISFNGVPASFNSALLSQNNAVVQIPAMTFTTIDTSKLYTIEYTTTGGTTIFNFKLGPAAPVITAISNVFANPGDSVFLYGTDLVLGQSLSYGGVNITSFRPNLDGTLLGFIMPNPAPVSGNVVFTGKSGTVDFRILALPTITGVSNANAHAGDSVYVYGTYLKGIQTLSFAGADITAYASADDGSAVGFVMPSVSQDGPVAVTTSFGAAITVYHVNTVASGSTTGVLANMEWGDYFGWAWWGGVGLFSGDSNSGWPPYNADFKGVLGSNTGMFAAYNTGTMQSGDGTAGDGKYNFPIGENQWVPVANLSDPVDSWAIQFEISVARPWNGGTLCFANAFAGNYVARYEPWQVTASRTAPFSTRGWTTVTLPLTAFRAADPTLGVGKGAPATSLTNLLGSSGKTSLNIYLHNFSGSATTTGFYAALDNIRVVKIK